MGKDYVDSLVIAIDTREQKPYEFPCKTKKTALKTGDYSIIGLEGLVCIERKSKADAYGTIAMGRKRFEKELLRMSDMEYKSIIIECTMKDFLNPPKYSRLSPISAIQSLLAWSVKYKVNILFCDNRTHAQSATYSLLRHFWRYYNLDKEKV